MTYIKRFGKWLFHEIRNHFITGLIIIVPLAITVLILIWLFDIVDNILQPVITAIAGHSIRGVGFAILLILIYLVGLVTSNLVGKKVYSYIEQFFFYKIPVVKQLYQGVKQILQSFSSSNNMKFLEVVLIEFPRKGLWSVGFVTNKVSDDSGNTIFHIFVPLAPNPISGYVVLMKEDQILFTKMTIEEAFKLVVSAGKYVAKEEGLIDKIHERTE